MTAAKTHAAISARMLATTARTGKGKASAARHVNTKTALTTANKTAADTIAAGA